MAHLCLLPQGQGTPVATRRSSAELWHVPRRPSAWLPVCQSHRIERSSNVQQHQLPVPLTAAALAGLVLLQPLSSLQASQLVVEGGSSPATASKAKLDSQTRPQLLNVAFLGGAAAAGGLAWAFLTSDPEKRRAKQTKAAGGDEKAAVQSYFDTKGFERWSRIYSQSEEVNRVQKDIREGHAVTVDKVLRLLDQGEGVSGTSICDAGCGTGSLSIPLALRGASVSASDISGAMANEARSRYEALISDGATAPQHKPVFEAKDLESLHGKWDTVTCLDVLIHYDQDSVDGMIQHLASLADNQLILSFAPKTFGLSLLKRIGEFFPGRSQATRAYLHAEADIEKALHKAGFEVVHKDLTSTSFYFSLLVQAVRRPDSRAPAGKAQSREGAAALV